MIDNADVQIDPDGNIWLHVQSFKGHTSVNLSIFITDSDLKDGIEAWAKEQLGIEEDED